LARLDFMLKTASPWFVYGADPRQRPELRAASIRGQLRYWLRALVGARTTDLSEVWKQETAVFGSTGSASPVSVHMLPQKLRKDDIRKVDMLPHRSGEKGSRSPSPKAEALRTDVEIHLHFLTRPGVDYFPQEFAPALSLWLLLGGVGKRSRRMFGAPYVKRVKVQPETLLSENWWAEPPKTQERFIDILRDRLAYYLPNDKLASGLTVPSFPTLHPSHSWIIVGREQFTDYEEANRALFSLLRSKTYQPYSDYFGFVKGSDRRASPLIAQVRQLGDGCYPVLTYLRSRPYPRHVDWDIVNRFMKDAIDKFNAETAWGGPFK
jgi:CRISPR-associated protein Cmr1